MTKKEIKKLIKEETGVKVNDLIFNNVLTSMKDVKDINIKKGCCHHYFLEFIYYSDSWDHNQIVINNYMED